MQRLLWVWLLLMPHYNWTNNTPSNDQTEQNDALGVHITNTFKPKNLTEVTVYNQPKDPDDCTGLIGVDLIERMRWLSNESWTKNIKQFPREKLLLYLERSPIEQVKFDSLRLTPSEKETVIQILGPDRAAFFTLMKKRLDDEAEARRFKPGEVALTLFLCILGL